MVLSEATKGDLFAKQQKKREEKFESHLEKYNISPGSGIRGDIDYAQVAIPSLTLLKRFEGFRIMSLPPELRNRIYDLVMDEHCDLVSGGLSPYIRKRLYPPVITEVSRQMRTETIRFFISKMTWQIELFDDSGLNKARQWLDGAITEENVSALGCLKVWVKSAPIGRLVWHNVSRKVALIPLPFIVDFVNGSTGFDGQLPRLRRIRGKRNNDHKKAANEEQKRHRREMEKELKTLNKALENLMAPLMERRLEQNMTSGEVMVALEKFLDLTAGQRGEQTWPIF